MSRHNEERSPRRPLRNKRGLVNRVRQLRGQMDAIERALDDEASCADLHQRIMATGGAINSLMAEVLEEHVQEHLLPPDSGRVRWPRFEARCLLVSGLLSGLKFRNTYGKSCTGAARRCQRRARLGCQFPSTEAR
jgi:DNA-binding FrmR family transcriptional regulator